VADTLPADTFQTRQSAQDSTVAVSCVISWSGSLEMSLENRDRQGMKRIGQETQAESVS
jgi:hypothetical protein